MKLAQFLIDLGSKNGAPGGGAAAALTGAAGTALVEMVARLNSARLNQSAGTAKKAATLRARLHTLIAQDARAFLRIQKIYKIRKSKPSAWQAALRAGAQPPLQICEAVAVAAQLAQKERSRTSPWLESDRKEALILLNAAFRAAVLNVEVNLKSIQDSTFVSNARLKIRLLARHVR